MNGRTHFLMKSSLENRKRKLYDIKIDQNKETKYSICMYKIRSMIFIWKCWSIPELMILLQDKENSTIFMNMDSFLVMEIQLRTHNNLLTIHS